MRQNIVHPGADELSYEIREIVEVANQLQAAGQTIYWENIGDPVAKGEKIPDWIKEKIIEVIKTDDSSFGYSPTKGDVGAREYIAHERNIEGGIQITADDILFFNGLGDAISKIYEYVHPDVRVIGPNPAYPTHSSAEAAHAGSHHLTYRLDPYNNWYPDLEDLRSKVEKDTSIGGIILINPDNPTGMVYSQEVIAGLVDIAREFNLFIISDEIYSNIFYGGVEHKKLAQVIGDVPAIAMRGISKEFPWPGARCGWVEFYNRDKDETFNRYCRSLVDAKMLEVCSTTLPQKMIPKVMGDERYYPYLAERNKQYEKRAQQLYDALADIEGLVVNKANGAFYMTVMFKKGVLTGTEMIPIENEDARGIVAPYLKNGHEADKRFVYNLLASTGICVVPLSTGFNSDLFGFRITLLERDDETFEYIVSTLKDAIEKYIQKA
ncbi:MAG: pyridoxal phosphate-dependent aminotransferase [Candidatus Paceibacterota bacterium]